MVKFLVSDMINSSDIEIILKINVTKGEKKRTSCLSLCVQFLFAFFWLRLGNQRDGCTRNYGAILRNNNRAKERHIFSVYRLSRERFAPVTIAIVTVTKRTFPVMADIATMRFLSEGRRPSVPLFHVDRISFISPRGHAVAVSKD